MNERYMFRVWDKVNNEWLEDFLALEVHCEEKNILRLEIGTMYIGGRERNEFVIEQCLGRKDKNGDLYFVGDILATENKSGIDPRTGEDCDTWDEIILPNSPVHWCDEYSTYYGVPDRNDESIYHAKYCKRIGNIHENPDMVKE